MPVVERLVVAEVPPSPKRVRALRWTAIALMFECAVVAVYALQFSPRKFAAVTSISVLVVGATAASASLVGLLFGIPRTVRVEPDTASSSEYGGGVVRYRDNTNLEEISDWLTKMLVGVGLTQIARVPDAVTSLGSALAPTFGDSSGSATVAICVIISSGAIGFIAGYIWARVDLVRLFTAAELTVGEATRRH